MTAVEKLREQGKLAGIEEGIKIGNAEGHKQGFEVGFKLGERKTVRHIVDLMSEDNDLTATEILYLYGYTRQDIAFI